MQRWIKWSIVVILGAVFCYAAFLYISPSGSRTYTFKPGQKNLTISELYPQERVEYPEKNLETGETYQRILDEPVFFDVIMPRLYQKATIEVEMENNQQPVIYTGLKAADEDLYDLQPLHYHILENKGWKTKIDEQENVAIYYNTGKFGKTIEDIIENNTEDAAIYELDVTVSEKITLEDYEPLKEERSIETSLRGPHEGKIYARKGDEIRFGIDWYDINRGFNRDQLHLRVNASNGDMLSETIHEDDGDEDASGIYSGPYHTEITLEAPYEGVFTVRMLNTDDMVIQRITTNARYLVFPELFIGGYQEYSFENEPQTDVELTTESTFLSFQPARKEHNQTVAINDEKITAIKDKLNVWEKEYDKGLKDISFDIGDMYVEGDGFFALTPETYFNPTNGVEQFPLVDSPRARDIDVLFAPIYEGSKDLAGDWFSASSTFDIEVNHIREHNMLSFALEAPGVIDRQDVLIREIRVTLEKEPITFSNLFEKIKGVFKRIE